MPRKTSLPKLAKRVTKSIRLTTEEADDLAQLVTGTAYAEAALLPRCRVQCSIQNAPRVWMGVKHALA
jgi:hypothetical protein